MIEGGSVAIFRLRQQCGGPLFSSRRGSEGDRDCDGVEEEGAVGGIYS